VGRGTALRVVQRSEQTSMVTNPSLRHCLGDVEAGKHLYTVRSRARSAQVCAGQSKGCKVRDHDLTEIWERIAMFGAYG
jgi:hypothetical protein